MVDYDFNEGVWDYPHAAMQDAERCIEIEERVAIIFRKNK